MPSGKNGPARESLFEQTKSNEGVTVDYEKQTKLPLPENAPNFAGELRGYYPNDKGGVWFPKPSTKGGRPKSKTKHDGVDIYAPFFDFPLETPIYAMVAGKATSKSHALEPNDIGNRVWLWPKEKDPSKLYVFGHLNRFRGRFKTAKHPKNGSDIKQGQLIGYAGHSGNADDKREASSIGAFNINAGHVHLKWQDKGVVADATVELGWKLRFDTEAEHGPLSLKAFTDKGMLLPEKISRLHPTGLLAAASRAAEERAWNSPAIQLPEPFDLIDVDDGDALKTTREAYLLMAKRLEAGDANAAHRERGLARFQHVIDEKEYHEKMGKTTDRSRLYRLFDEIRATAARFKTPGSTGAQCSTDIMRLLFMTYQVLYVLMGGPALHAVARKSDEGAGAVVDSGLGLYGSARALSAGHGQGVMQHVWLPDTNAEDKKTLQATLTLGVSFGAGTEWHAIMDETVLARLKDETEPQKRVRRFVATTFRLADTARLLFDATARTTELIRGGRTPANNGRFKVVDRFVDLIVAGEDSAVDEFEKTLPKLTEASAKPAIGALLKHIADTGKEALELAQKAFEKGQTTVPRITPQIGMLWLEPFPRTRD